MYYILHLTVDTIETVSVTKHVRCSVTQILLLDTAICEHISGRLATERSHYKHRTQIRTLGHTLIRSTVLLSTNNKTILGQHLK